MGGLESDAAFRFHGNNPYQSKNVFKCMLTALGFSYCTCRTSSGCRHYGNVYFITLEFCHAIEKVHPKKRLLKQTITSPLLRFVHPLQRIMMAHRENRHDLVYWVNAEMKSISSCKHPDNSWTGSTMFVLSGKRAAIKWDKCQWSSAACLRQRYG